ncbi:uncharacterized protein C12B10.15c [Melanaphis sacchari]|uniref:uncharacterized protein C12B10.15c n=1 Tax=Melanaphis sacchari TaxID=742174 RepID=UPI000DC130EA|nr:uncharacterized protein C12B10.15c [Melanaphis sacchari]
MRLIINRSEHKRVAEDSDVSAVGSDQQAVHLLPCKIHTTKSDGDRQTLTAPVDRYFNPYKAAMDDEDALWHASLRGKPLTGVKLSMPDGYVGVLCVGEDSDATHSTVDDSTATVKSVTGEVTQELMYWNWDRIPTREDPLLSAFDWVRVSEAIMTNND